MTELTTITSPFTELTNIASRFPTIELSESQKIASLFAGHIEKVNELTPMLQTLNRENPTPEDSRKAREARLMLVKNRGQVKITKENLKRGIIDKGKLIDGLVNFVEKSSCMLEADFEKIEKHVENQEKARKEALRIERTAELQAINVDVTFYSLAEMNDDQYIKLKQSSLIAYNLAIEQKKKDEAEKIERENKEAERQAQIAKENQELREKLAKQAREQKEAADKAAAEARRVAEEQKKKDDEIARLQKEAADKAAAEARIIEEQRRKEKEAEMKKLQEERDALLAPDKEKVKKYFDQIMLIPIPTIQDVQMHIKFEKFISSLSNLITNFK